MIVINTVSEKYFSLNGVTYAKIYQPLIQGEFNVGIYNIYNTGQQILQSTSFDIIEVNGVVYGSVNDLVLNMLDVVFSNDLSDAVSEINNLKIYLEEKTEKGGYSGTAQDLKNELDTKIFEGAFSYQSLDLLNAVDPVPDEGTPAKVVNDNDSVLNGGYSVLNGVWVKDYSSIRNVIEEDNEVDSVTGKAVYEEVKDKISLRSEKRWSYQSLSGISFDGTTIKSTDSSFIFNHNKTGTTASYILISAFSYDLQAAIDTVGSSENYFTVYIKNDAVLELKRNTGEGALVEIDETDFNITQWNSENANEPKLDNALILFIYNSLTGSLTSPFFDENISRNALNLNTDYKFNYGMRSLISFENKIITSEDPSFVFNNAANTSSVYVRFDPFDIDLSDITADWATVYVNDPVIMQLHNNNNTTDTGVLKIFTNEDIIIKEWNNSEIKEVVLPTTLVLFHYSSKTNSLRTEFKPDILDTGNSNFNTPLVNLHQEIYDKLPYFISKYAYGASQTAESPCNIVLLGDSLFARELHTSEKDVIPSENPPMLVTKNIGAYLWDFVQGQKPQYSRYDKAGVFTETGVWTEVASDASWDDNGDRPNHIKRTSTENGAVAFTTDAPYFNFIDRVDVDGGAIISVAVSGGDSRILARVENTLTWVEANGFTFSQKKEDFGGVDNSLGYGNTIYQRRIEFKKTGTGVGNEDTITISKPNDTTNFSYWGLEEILIDKPYTRIINSARGGHKLIDLDNYYEDDLFNRNPDLVVLEIPLLNMITADSSIEYNLNQLQDFVWGDREGNLNANSLKNRSNDWQDFNVLLVVPHYKRSYFDSDDGSFLNLSSGNTAQEIYKSVKGLIYSKGDLPMIDISNAFLNEIDSDYMFLNKYTALSSSGLTGTGYLNDSIHQNDKGTKVWAKHLCPFLQIG